MRPMASKGVVHSAVRQVLDGLYGVLGRCVHHVGRAQVQGVGELRLHNVDGYDLPRSGYARPLYGREADASQAKDSNGASRLNAGRVDDRPHAGYDTAANKGSAIEWHVVVDLDQRVLVDQHPLSVAGEVEDLGDRSAAPGKAEARRVRLRAAGSLGAAAGMSR